jgi:CheY-like chemotaxis protein
MVYGLMQQHGGLVHVESAPRQGTTIRLCFPPVAAPAVKRPHRDSRTGALGGNESILLVEDEDALRRVTRRALERYGYQVLTAANGRDAVQVFQQQAGRVDLVISDLVMPVMSGVQLYHALRRSWGPFRFILTSGYAGREATERTSLDPSVPFLAKPWSLEDLLRHVRASLDGTLKHD